jgi:hypothetical protein
MVQIDRILLAGALHSLTGIEQRAIKLQPAANRFLWPDHGCQNSPYYIARPTNSLPPVSLQDEVNHNDDRNVCAAFIAVALSRTD